MKEDVGKMRERRKMSEKPLDLEELADEIIRVEYPTYEQAPPGLREAIIRKKERIKQILEVYINQTVGRKLSEEDLARLEPGCAIVGEVIGERLAICIGDDGKLRIFKVVSQSERK